MAYKVIILYRLYMPSYVLGTFTEYPTFSLIIILYIFILNYYLPETGSSFFKQI